MKLRDSELEELEEEIDQEEEISREKYYKEKREAMETEDLGDGFLEDETEKPTHTMLLDGLVKEVEIFADDEDFITPTKKWKTVVGIIVFLVIIGIGVFLVVYFNPFKKEKGNEAEPSTSKNEIPKDYRYEIGEKEIIFYEGNKSISTYICKDTCSAYSLGRYQYFSKEEQVIALQDGEEFLLYNFKDGKKISDNFTRMENLIKEDKTVAFIVTNTNKKTGIIDTKGNIIIPFEYDNFAYSFGGGDVTDYSYEKNLITASKDDKWGLITLDTGKEQIPFIYEDIYFNNYNAVSVRKEGLWYLVDLDGKQILEEGYDMIIPLASYVLVAKEDKFNILNYKGEKVVSKDIPTYVKGFRGRTISEIPTFKIEEDGSIINIFIMKDETEYSTYKFNTVNGEVTEVIS